MNEVGNRLGYRLGGVGEPVNTGVVTQLTTEDNQNEEKVGEDVKIPMFLHTNGKEYKEEQCWNNKAAWVSKLATNERILRDWQNDLLKDDGNDKLRRKIERKKKTIANNHKNIRYWDDAANGVLAEKIKLKLI